MVMKWTVFKFLVDDVESIGNVCEPQLEELTPLQCPEDVGSFLGSNPNLNRYQSATNTHIFWTNIYMDQLTGLTQMR